MVDIYLQESPRGEAYIRICDLGMALMRLSYSYDLNTDARRRIFDDHSDQQPGCQMTMETSASTYRSERSTKESCSSLAASKRCATCATGRGKPSAAPSTTI